MSRSRKIGRWALVAFVAAGVLAALYFDIERRREAEAPHNSELASTPDLASIPVELVKRFEDPSAFRTFCEQTRDKYLAMNARHKSLQHRRRSRAKQLDKAGKVVADESLVEIVDFPGGQERHQIVEQKDLLTGKPIEGESPIQKGLATGRAPFQYPFMPESTWEDFSYGFGGVEMLDDKPVVKVAFTPSPPFGRKLAGTIWADAESGQPLRFAARWFKPTGVTHKVEMNFTYGPSENGFPQIRHVESDGAGGALFVYRRYVVAFDIDDYRPRESQ